MPPLEHTVDMQPQLTLHENSWANTSLTHLTWITRLFVVTSNVRATLLAPGKIDFK